MKTFLSNQKGALLSFAICILLITSTSAQTRIKDFFIPTNGFNKSEFYMPDSKTGERTEMNTTMWYIGKGNGYDIFIAKLFNGEASSITTWTVELTSNEVKLKKSILTNPLVTNNQKVYEPAQTYLKLPIGNQKATWIFKDHSGDKYSCTAELTVVDIKGQKKQAIKVVKKHFENGKITWASRIDYYVKGIGFWRTESMKGIVLEKFSKQSYDPEAVKMIGESTESRSDAEGSEIKAEIKDEPLFYKVVDQFPIYGGGDADLSNYINTNIVYPPVAKRNGIEGLVVVEFIVGVNGELSNISIVKSLGKDINAEAIRLIKEMPNNWKPAKLNGKEVPFRYTLPISFRLH